MFPIVAFLVLAALAGYWFWLRPWASPVHRLSPFAVLLVMLLLLVYTDRDGDRFSASGGPIMVAVAADVSLSMGTLPEPAAHGEIGTRLERAQGVLLPLLADLGATARPVMISVTAFTSKSETILAWDDDLSLVREIVEYVLTTGLITEAGSDLGAALNGVIPLIDSLPEAYRGPEYTKFLLLLSDGEQTVTRANSATAIAKLHELGVRIIALHVGLSDVPEGLPVYDENNGFVGFEEVSGQIFSVPDPDVMHLVAGEDPARGLFVQAENNDAAATITRYIGLQTSSSAADTLRVVALVLLWGLLMWTLLRWF
ncbi:MAG: vWA domain-containing protein [Woeseiaceae bacterium]